MPTPETTAMMGTANTPNEMAVLGAQNWDVLGVVDNATQNAINTTVATAVTIALPPSGRNRIINGDMRVDQRNEGAAVTVNATSSFRSVDKWNGVGTAAAGVYTLQRNAASPPAGFTNYVTATTTTADASPAAASRYTLDTRIEGFLCQDMGFGTALPKNISISFWARSSKTGNFSVGVVNSAQNRSYVFVFSIGAAATWTPVKVTLPADNTGTWLVNNGIGVWLKFDLGSGSNFQATALNTWQAGNVFETPTSPASIVATNGATFDITGAQLEVANGATSFDYLLYGAQLLLCQRYYQKSFAQGTAPAQNIGNFTGEQCFPATFAGTNACFYPVSLQVPLRAIVSAGTLTTYNPAAANAQARNQTRAADCSATGPQNVGGNSYYCLTITGSAATAVGDLIGFHWTVDADL